MAVVVALNEVRQALVQVADDDILHQQLLSTKNTFPILMLLNFSPITPISALPDCQPQLV